MSEDEYIYVGNFSDSLSICITPDPTAPAKQLYQSCRWLGLTFGSSDKEALFFRALKVFNPAAAVGGRIPVEDYRRGKWEELWAQFERSVEQATAELPMLRRLREEYEDAVFLPDEVRVLNEECLKVSSGTDDLQALSALGKLTRACDEALKESFGLLFASD